MTVRIYPATLKHPSECPVCEGTKRVAVRSVVGVESRAGLWRGLLRWLPTRLAVVIDCPQCTDAGELLAHLPRRPGEGGGPRATA
jgi:hypothetical protein